MQRDELTKLKATIDKIYDSPEYVKRRQRMDRYYKYYCGYYWPEGEEDEEDAKESAVFINYIFSTISTIAPMLTDNKPIWSCRSLEYPFLQPIANLYKAAGDSIWEIEDMDTKVFRICLDALITGYGVAQVSFDPGRTVRGEISIDVVEPRTYFQAPGFEDNWDAPICGTVADRSLWWVRQAFPENGKKVKASDAKDRSIGDKVKGLFKGKMDHEYVGETAKIYTAWMRDDEVMTEKDEDGKKTEKAKYPNGRFVVFSEDLVELDDKEYAYNHGKPPWVLCYDYIIPHSHVGMGEVQQIEGLVLDTNLAIRKLSKHVRMWSDPPIIVDGGSGLDPQDVKEDLVKKGPRVWTVNAGTNPPKPMEIPSVDQGVLAYINGMPQNINEVSGVTDTSKGMAAKKQRQSAREITSLLETSYTRTRQRVRNLEAFIKRVFTLVIEIMQQYYDEDRNFSLRNNNGENEWYKIGNSAQTGTGLMKPPGKGFVEKPDSENDEEYQMQKQQWEDYAALMEHVADEKSIFFKFRIDMETNSMLPMDKQSLANLGLQIAQLGRMDTLSLLEILHWPNPQKVVDRLKQEAKDKMEISQQPQPQEAV